jgi:hypothetical protein
MQVTASTPNGGMTIDSRSMTGKQDRLRAGLIALVLAVSPSAFGQGMSELRPVSSGGPNAAASQHLRVQVSGPVIGEIDDPATGCRWILLGNAAHPEGPGRVLLVGGPVAGREAVVMRIAHPAKESARDEPIQPLIHLGDIIVVEEHTPVVDARLAAVALSGAAPGEEFRARLKIGGNIVRARAIDAARAALVTQTEAQP